MPFPEAKPLPNLAPLDQSLNDIEIKAKQPPIDIVPPVPESRVVEVQSNTSFFGMSVGMYDPFTHSEKGASLNLEWQPGVRIAGVLQPLFGAIVTTNGTMLGYGGIGIPFNITDRVFMMPSVAVGAYHKGGGYDLDRTLAFRAGTELAYQFDDKSRLGLNFHVVTNGKSLKREDRTEIIGLAYTVPIEILSKPPSAVMPAPAEAPAPDVTIRHEQPHELP